MKYSKEILIGAVLGCLTFATFTPPLEISITTSEKGRAYALEDRTPVMYTAKKNEPSEQKPTIQLPANNESTDPLTTDMITGAIEVNNEIYPIYYWNHPAPYSPDDRTVVLEYNNRENQQIDSYEINALSPANNEFKDIVIGDVITINQQSFTVCAKEVASTIKDTFDYAQQTGVHEYQAQKVLISRSRSDYNHAQTIWYLR